MPGIRRSPANYRPLAGSERPRPRETGHLGAAEPNETAQIQLIVRRRPGGPPLKDLGYFQRTRINARELPTRRQFEADHGATQADLGMVEAFCRSQKLQVLESNCCRRWVVARGTVAQLNAAFAIELQSYQSLNGNHRGYDGTANLPTNLAAIVEAVNGLDDRPVPGKHLGLADPPIISVLTPLQVAQLYSFPSGTGQGQTIGIYDWGGDGYGYALDDVTATLSNWGVSAPPPTDFPSGSNPAVNGIYEPIMDITIATAIAPKASIVVYHSPTSGSGGTVTGADIITTLTWMVHPAPTDPVPTVLSISYQFSNGGDEDTSFLSASDYNQINALFQEAANLGITVLTGSADTGAYVASLTQAQTVYPATDPYVLTCGGTTVGDISGAAFDEYVWNDTNVVAGKTYANATGGGVSARWPVPPYQATLDTLPTRLGTGTAGRGIPDVAGNASVNSGYQITVNQKTVPSVGGTSIVAPLYAGLVALINENLGESIGAPASFSIGFLNPTIYALAASICRDVTGAAGPTNNSYIDPYVTPPVDLTGYPAGVGWDACTGWGSITGAALLSALQGLFQKSMTFILQRTTFGEDEVAAAGGIFSQALFVVVDGLRPSDFPGGGITTTSLTGPPPTPAQLAAWAPVIASPVGPGGVATNISFTPTAVASEGPSLSPKIQRFTFTYQAAFSNPTPFTTFPSADFPSALTLQASLAVSGLPDASAEIELIEAADPYFSSESNGGLFYLSEDLRVFYAIQGSTLFGYPAPGGLGSTPADALAFIQWIIANLSGANGTTASATALPNSDSFENLPTAESSALSLLPTVAGPQSDLNVYNFALARVRLNASEGTKNTRAFFRLFQSQSVAMPYQTPPEDEGVPVVSPLNNPYRQYSDGIQDGQKIPLLGTGADGTHFVTVPCFASARVANMTDQTDSPNAKPLSGAPGDDTAYAYFGAWLDSNQTTQLFPSAPHPGPNQDGPFTGPGLQTVAQVLARGAHQCLIVEIIDDEAPVLDNATPGSSDKIAQRNLAYTVVANPGLSDSRLATHTFEVRPSPIQDEKVQRVDELMIDWGNLPEGSLASIYLPAVAAADVLALAGEMYPTHNLGVSDPHTLLCATGGITYIPVPKGASPESQNYAGLFSVQLPAGVKRGQAFSIVVRQVTSAVELSVNNVARQRVGLPTSRYVFGAFQITIPVSVKSEMLVPEERILSVMRWIQKSIRPDDRWHLVFIRYLDQLAARVDALGGDAGSVPATQTGIWPGLFGHGDHGRSSFTGKVDGIVYDRFGDFQAFILVTLDGERRRLESRETRVLHLVQRAWEDRILATVVVRRDHSEQLLEILLHGASPHLER
jgi:hypothetical protein